MKKQKKEFSVRTMLLIELALFIFVAVMWVINFQLSSELHVARENYQVVSDMNVKLWKSVSTLEDKMLEKELIIYRDVCSINTFKSWMDYLEITDHSSTQWKLQQIATTEINFGFRWIEQKYIMVAMAKEYGPVGSKYLITFESGQNIHVMIGEVKQESRNSPDGSIIEFIIDSNITLKSIIRSGNFNDIFKGSITAIMEE